MNTYFIENNPKINGNIQKIVRETTHTEISKDGVSRMISTQDYFLNKEPDYIKVYTDCQLILNNLDTALSPYIIAFAKHMTYANHDEPYYRCVIRTDKITRDSVSKLLKVSDRQVQRAIKNLVDNEIFIPIKKDGMKLRGIYFVNPWVISKGEWKDIKSLRQEFEYVSGGSSICLIDEVGNRKVLIPSNKNEE